MEDGEDLASGRLRAADSTAFARSRTLEVGRVELMHSPSYIRPMQLFRVVSEVSESREILSVFQLRSCGAVVGGEAAEVTLVGAGDDVPFVPLPVGVEVPDAIFCSFTVCRHRLMISDANCVTFGSRALLLFTLLTIFPIAVARSNSSVGLIFCLRSCRMLRMFDDGSFAAMAFCSAEPLDNISRRSIPQIERLA